MSARSVATSFNCSDICRGRESKSRSKVTWSRSRRLTDGEFFSSTSRSNNKRSQRKPRLVDGRSGKPEVFLALRARPQTSNLNASERVRSRSQQLLDKFLLIKISKVFKLLSGADASWRYFEFVLDLNYESSFRWGIGPGSHQ